MITKFDNFNDYEKVNVMKYYIHDNLEAFENSLKDIFINKNVNFFSFKDGEFKTIKVVNLKIKRENPNFSAIYFFDENNKKYHVHVGYPIRIIDHKYAANKRKEEEEMRLKYKDVDPYGEEEWENENKINESSTSYYDYIIEVKDNEYIDFLNYLDELGFKWGGGEKLTKFAPTNNMKNGVVYIHIRDNEVYHGTKSKDEDYWGTGKINTDVSGFKELYDKTRLDKKRKKEELRLKYLDVDPYCEEVWESKSKKKRAATKIKMAEIDPYGEEDWGWDVKINDDDFKDKYIVFKRGVFNNYEYYFGLLSSHYLMHVSHGPSQDLNIIKNLNQLMPLTNREIDRIRKNKIELVPHMVGGFKWKNEYGNSNRYTYSSLHKDVLFLDKDYMDNYLYMNENVNEEIWNESMILENKNFGFSWINVNDTNEEELKRRLKGKTIILYKYENGKYSPFNKLSPKIEVKKIDKHYFGGYIIITKWGGKIELKYNDKIKIIGNKNTFQNIHELDPYGEEDWND